MDRRESAALDRHITGNYGEDQFDRFYGEEPPEEVEAGCSICGQGYDHHDLESREDSYGREWEAVVCTWTHIPVEPPECGEGECSGLTCHCQACGEFKATVEDYCARCYAREMA